MDNIIFTLHPSSDAAQNILKDPRNTDMLHYDGIPQGETLALSLLLNRPPKTGTNYIIGRHNDADIVLTDPSSSARHCIISVSDKGIPVLRDQSTNGTLIDGVHCNNQSLEIINGMRIDIRNAVFDIRVPFRGQDQEDYQYNVKRANQKRAATPLLSSCLQPAPSHTTLVETLGPYTLTHTMIDSTEMSRTEIVRKGRSFFVAKRFNRQGLVQREVRAWKRIVDNKIQHVGFSVLGLLTEC